MTSPGDASDQLRKADKKIAELEALAKECHDAAHRFLERAEKAEAEVKSLLSQKPRENGVASPPPTTRAGDREHTCRSCWGWCTTKCGCDSGDEPCDECACPWAAASPAAPSGVSPSPPVDSHDHEYFFEDASGKTVYVHHSAICWCKEAARKERSP